MNERKLERGSRINAGDEGTLERSVGSKWTPSRKDPVTALLLAWPKWRSCPRYWGLRMRPHAAAEVVSLVASAGFNSARRFPEPAGNLDRVNAGLPPPSAFVAGAMCGPGMQAAERDREFIAVFAPRTRRVTCGSKQRRSMEIRGSESNSTSLWTSTELWTQELRRLLASKGCTFETHKGGSGHLTVRRGDRKSQLPMHGSRKELGKGLVNKILKDLGLK
jgi:mRNA interferase HicA